jgi:molecular chaperone DnaK (HSP70)
MDADLGDQTAIQDLFTKMLRKYVRGRLIDRFKKRISAPASHWTNITIEAILTVPCEMLGYSRSTLKAAATRAGFSDIVFLTESQW